MMIVLVRQEMMEMRFLSVALRHLPVDAVVTFMRKSFAKECGEMKRPILQGLMS